MNSNSTSSMTDLVCLCFVEDGHEERKEREAEHSHRGGELEEVDEEEYQHTGSGDESEEPDSTVDDLEEMANELQYGTKGRGRGKRKLANKKANETGQSGDEGILIDKRPKGGLSIASGSNGTGELSQVDTAQRMSVPAPVQHTPPDMLETDLEDIIQTSTPVQARQRHPPPFRGVSAAYMMKMAHLPSPRKYELCIHDMLFTLLSTSQLKNCISS